MLRRLHKEQPESFAFTPANQAWAEAQITKYPEGRQASAIIPLLWRAQEQEGWLTRPAIEHVAEMLGMAYIRALEVATFYFMFQLQPVGSVAHVQVCGTTSCMICGAEDLIAVCREKIAAKAHELSADGRFSWEEVECLGACANAPMAQIGKDYYEDLTVERFGEIIDELAAGRVPVPGPQNGRYAAEPLSGLTSLQEHESGRTQYNASVQAAVDLGDTVKRIDGSEVPLRTPWHDAADSDAGAGTSVEEIEAHEPRPSAGRPADSTGATEQEAPAEDMGRPEADATGGAPAGVKPGPLADASTTPSGTDADSEDEEAPQGSGPKGGAGTEPGGGKAATKGGTSTPAAGSEASPGGRSVPEGPESTDVSRDAASDEADEMATAPHKDPAVPPAEASASASDPASGEASGAASASGPGTRPEGLSGARGGQPDDLKHIKGVGPALERQLHELGYYHYDQIAAWGPEEVAWVDQNLKGFKGRVSRDDWVSQAKTLADGGETEFSARAKKGDADDE